MVFEPLVIFASAIIAFLIWRGAKVRKGRVRLADTGEADVYLIGSERIRLWAVDTFQGGQPWYPERGRERVDMRTLTMAALEQMIGDRPITCVHIADEKVSIWAWLNGQRSRMVCQCSVDGEDIGSWLLRNGYGTVNEEFLDEAPLQRSAISRR